MTIGEGSGPTLGGVHVWSFERAGDGVPAILLLSAAAHGCVLPPENLEISADWIGGAVRAVERNRQSARPRERKKRRDPGPGGRPGRPGTACAAEDGRRRITCFIFFL